MSLIEKALERAKQMGQLRSQEPAADTRRQRAAPSDRAAALRPRESYSPFPVIEFNAQACTQNHVLIGETQLADAGSAAAAYRLLRSRLLHRLKDIGSPFIGITSAGPGEGKTLTALNLSIHLARDKQHVVYLLDLDMRNPSVFRTVGCRPTHELSGYLQGSLKPEDVLFATSIENLVFAGVGAPTQGASELLSSPRLDELLDYIRRRSPHSIIICDLPPVLSTDEPLVVAPRTDCMLLVVSEGITRRDRLARAVDMLGDFKVAGIVVNRSSEELGKDYYGYWGPRANAAS